MKDTSELIDFLLADAELNRRIAETDHLQQGTVQIVLRIQERMRRIDAQVVEIHSYTPAFLEMEGRHPTFPAWLASEQTATTALLVGALNDWAQPVEVRDMAARMLQRVLFGTYQAPAEWWATMTGADMVYAIGYTHARVPVDVAPAVLGRTRGGVHWLRQNKGLQLTDRSFFAYVQESQEWQARARELRSN
jgi:hypothetical protein